MTIAPAPVYVLAVVRAVMLGHWALARHAAGHAALARAAALYDDCADLDTAALPI